MLHTCQPPCGSASSLALLGPIRSARLLLLNPPLNSLEGGQQREASSPCSAPQKQLPTTAEKWTSSAIPRIIYWGAEDNRLSRATQPCFTFMKSTSAYFKSSLSRWVLLLNREVKAVMKISPHTFYTPCT